MRATLRMGLIVAAVLAVGLWAQPQAGAQSNTTAWKESGPELKVYDIKALFARTPIYNFAQVPGTDSAAISRSNASGTFGGGGASLYQEASKEDPDYSGDSVSRARQLQGLVESLVKPKEPWESLGGRSTIQFVYSRGLMFVSTTEDGHKQIEALLQQILPGDKRNVFIDIQVVDLDRAAVGNTPVGFMARSDPDKATLKKAVRKVLFSTGLSGTDGQVLSSEKGGRQRFVTEATPVVADSSVGYQVNTEALTEGLSAQVQAALSSDGAKATFDFRLLLTRIVGQRQLTVEGTAKNRVASAPLDLPRTVRDAQAGTLLLPLDTPTIVAGGSVPQSLLTGNEADTAQTEVFYVVTVRSPTLPMAAAAPVKK